MRTISCHILVLFMPCLAFSQIEAKMIDFDNKLELNLEKEIFSKPMGNKIYSVNVIDARDDTGAVGYHYIKARDAHRYGIRPGSSKKNKDNDVWSKVYRCEPSLKDGFTRWVNEYLQCRNYESAKNKLLIVVKKFWLSDEADKIRFSDDSTGRPANGWGAGVLCKLELYLERDSIFYPLYRIDSVFTFKERLNDYRGTRFVDNAGLFVNSVLKNSLENLVDIDPDEIVAKRRKLLFQDINREYSKSLEIPVLKAVDLKKGVYKDFTEFKANLPSITVYEFRKGPMGDMLFIKDGDSEYPARNAWGFCDGRDIFINSGDKYSKLVRRENTFYFFGIKEVSRKNKHIFLLSSGLNYATNTGPKKSVYKAELKYYQIDMESGEVY